MAQIRQRKVQVQVTSADPSGKVFRGIYADSSYRTLLTSDKTYDFKLNAGQTEELYIRYSQKPITITFKSHPAVHYQVTGSFGTVEVNDEDVVKTVEFPTDTTPNLDMEFTSAKLLPAYEGEWKIINTKIDESIVSLPNTVPHVTPGTNLTFEIEIASTTTTTTSTPAPATLLFKNVNNIAYTATYNGGELVSVTNADVSKLIDVHSITDGTQVTLNSVISASDSWRVNQVKVGGTVRELPYTFVVNSGTSTVVEPVFEQVTTTTTTTPPPAILKLKSNASGTVVKLTTEGLDPETVSLPLSGTSQSSIKIDMKNAPLVDN